jgi:ABC-type polysaccharide/polyol phosphate export permease
MLILKENTHRAQEIIVELTTFYLLKINSGKAFKTTNMYFNWGVIWSSFSPLILVAGWALLFSLGIRGSGYDLSYFVFLLLFGIGFTKSVSRIISFQLDPIFFNKKEINILNAVFAWHISEFYLLLVRFFLLILILNLFNFELAYYHLIYGCLIINALGFFYGVILNSIFKNNTFQSEVHNYFLQVLFFTSSVIIPLPILPESIRNIFLYNPLAHINEWIKSASTGITYDYINILYPLMFLLFFAIISPIFLWFTNKNQQLDK